jgi:general stress protein 26
MAKEAEITGKFWKSLRSDRTAMLGLAGVDEGHAQPMTVLLDGDRDAGPMWIFSAKGVDLVRALDAGKAAVLHFAARDHGLFATVHGRLTLSDDRAVIDRLWNRFIAAWYEQGKDDPKLQLLRFDPDRAQIGLNENSTFAAIKLLLGQDPKKEYQDKVAEVKVG